MYDIILNFIQNSLFGTSADVSNVPQLLAITSVILIYVFLIKVIIWILSYFSWR